MMKIILNIQDISTTIFFPLLWGNYLIPLLKVHGYRKTYICTVHLGREDCRKGMLENSAVKVLVHHVPTAL